MRYVAMTSNDLPLVLYVNFTSVTGATSRPKQTALPTRFETLAQTRTRRAWNAGLQSARGT